MMPHGHYCVPIVSAGMVLGVITLYLGESHVRDGVEERFLAAIANALAGVIRRKQAEEEKDELHSKLQKSFDALSISHKEWQDTFDGITDLIYITDTAFTIIKANKSFADFVGLSPQAVVRRKCYELLHKSDGPPRECPHTRSLQAQKPVRSEYVERQSNRTFMVTSFPFFSEAGALIGAIVVAKDVTEVKEKEMRLIMSERLASLGQMASGIAHEINNPLAAIAGCAEGLQNRVLQNRYEREFFSRYLEIIQDEIKRCKTITTGMLSFVRRTSDMRKPVDVGAVLARTMEIVDMQGRLKEVKVVAKYGEDLPPVAGNEGELRQVFLALITNALDAMGDRGRLEVEARKSGDRLLVTIGDSGGGISEENLPKVFDPFFTTKAEKGGTGLGLSIGRKIIMNHGGAIDVSSEEDKGTLFTVALPVYSDDFPGEGRVG